MILVALLCLALSLVFGVFALGSLLRAPSHPRALWAVAGLGAGAALPWLAGVSLAVLGGAVATGLVGACLGGSAD